MRLVALSYLSLLAGAGAVVLPQNSSSTLKPMYAAYSDKTPVFRNDDLIKELSTEAKGRLSLGDKSSNETPPGFSVNNQTAAAARLARRDELPVGTCAPGIPCVNGACCSNTGVCSYAPSSCAPENCISNCDAKAPCGEYADPGSANCPLNVCCSQYGFCGSTSEFCGTGCQAGFGGCGPPPVPSCSIANSASQRRIGYYESWATTRPCDVVAPEDLDLAGLTHINFAFAFFHPTTFQMTPMDANAGTLYERFTALKNKKPGLETWIAIGGWSFNDPTNVPDTQHAFSDMVSTQGNRQAFISSLISFMHTYGFDGVDLDWEYPVADDRGGDPADFANFPIFLAELRAALGDRGISVTLPSSFWYLQHFDLLAMEPHVSWFNVMSYDIHGVWDSSNKYTGPYIRPHTNLTEIEEGLSLLWRAGLRPEKVVLGLGWYGRSFTLEDPNCSTPNGVCRFTAGGAPGECSRSAGTLTNAEIKRIINSNIGVESYDAEAGVRWLKWNSDQWVSYDDGITTQQKIALANRLCLGGMMIWALDQDDADGSSMNDLHGVGVANGITPEQAEAYRKAVADAALQQAVGSSCYWSLCGTGCVPGYFGVTEARGQVADILRNSVCPAGEVQTLCCAPGTQMGTCKWEGFRGVGFPCSPACSNPEATVVARNTNSYTINEAGQTQDLTCMGGYQAYCCLGFKPSTITNSGNLALYGQGPLLKRRAALMGVQEHHGLEKRSPLMSLLMMLLSPKVRGKLLAAQAASGLCALGAGPAIVFSGITFGLTAIGEAAVCAAAFAAWVAVGFAILDWVRGWVSGNGMNQPNRGTPTSIDGRTHYGQWPILDFGSVSTPGCDCVVTYTCKYGMGWDEICDNQRWAINKGLNGRTVYNMGAARAVGSYVSWSVQRHSAFWTMIRNNRVPYDARCQVDEFPMGALVQAAQPNPQMVRLVHWRGNNGQGLDFKAWKTAQWKPCSTFRRDVCNINDGGPPVTWKFNALNGNRGPGSGQRFISAYGFDSETIGSWCTASFSFSAVGGGFITTSAHDPAFRVLNDDPMFGAPYNYPRQRWDIDPRPLYAPRPYNFMPGIFIKRELASLNNVTEVLNPASSSSVPCYAVPKNRQHHLDLRNVNGPDDLDFDQLDFFDLGGKPIDGHACDFLYSQVPSAGATQGAPKPDQIVKAAEPMMVTAANPGAVYTDPARPGSGGPDPETPPRTKGRVRRGGSVVTMRP